MNRKYRNRSGSKAISLSFPLCLSFFSNKACFFSLHFFFFFWEGWEEADWLLIFFKAISTNRSCLLLFSKTHQAVLVAWHEFLACLFSPRCCFCLQPYCLLLEDTIITSDFGITHFKPQSQNKLQCHPLPCTYEIARSNYYNVGCLPSPCLVLPVPLA